MVDTDLVFQSRNRGSFLFKYVDPSAPSEGRIICFNLVIEVLFFSSSLSTAPRVRASSFQSRNRGSFLFKSKRANRSTAGNSGFNLVIEVLFFSRRCVLPKCLAVQFSCFNLVIEVLFFSSEASLV